MTRPLLLCCDCEGTQDEILRLAGALEAASWRASFFFVGETVAAFPSIVRDIAAVHDVHSHTWSHPNLRKLPKERQRAEILAGRHAVEDCIEREARGFRAPMHHLNADTLAVLHEEGFTFDASILYFRYDPGALFEFHPTWFREWMPLYDSLNLAPSQTFAWFKWLSRRAKLPVLPAHPQYGGRDATLANGLRDFLKWARDAGFEPTTGTDLMSMPVARQYELLGPQRAVMTRLNT